MANAPRQVDLFTLDWMPLNQAADLFGLAETWLANELLGGHLAGVHVRITPDGAGGPWGIEVWMPSLGMWAQAHREQFRGGMSLLRKQEATS